MTPPTLDNLEELCRLCLRSKGEVSAFGTDGKSSSPYAQRILDCVSVKIAEDDSFPSFVCRGCLGSVNSWLEFKKNCLEAQGLLFQAKGKGTPNDKDKLDFAINTKDDATKIIKGDEETSISLPNGNLHDEGSEEKSNDDSSPDTNAQHPVSLVNGTTEKAPMEVDPIVIDSNSEDDVSTRNDAESEVSNLNEEGRSTPSIHNDSTSQQNRKPSVEKNDKLASAEENDLSCQKESSSPNDDFISEQAKDINSEGLSSSGSLGEKIAVPEEGITPDPDEDIVTEVPIVPPVQVITASVDISNDDSNDEPAESEQPGATSDESSGLGIQSLKIETSLSLYHGQQFDKDNENFDGSSTSQPVDKTNSLIRCGPNVFSSEDSEATNNPHLSREQQSGEFEDSYFNMVSIKEEPVDDGYEDHNESGTAMEDDSWAEDIVDENNFAGDDQKFDVCVCLLCDRKYTTFNQFIKHLRAKFHKKSAALYGGRRRVSYKADRGFILCRPCDFEVNSKKIWELHLDTERHKDRLRRYKELKYNKPGTKGYENELFCTFCSITFTSRSEKHRHDNTPQHRLCVAMRKGPAVETLKYCCPYKGCTQAFREGWYLISHMRAHTNPSSRASLRNSPRIAAGPSKSPTIPNLPPRRSIPPPVQPKPAPQEPALVSPPPPSTIPSQKQINKSGIQYSCPKCYLPFSSAVGRSNHIRGGACGRLLSKTPKTLLGLGLKHKSQASTTCHSCNLRFASFEIYLNHMNTYHKGPPKSRFIQRANKLGSHSLRIGIKKAGVFKCSQCPKTFDYLHSLNMHKRMHVPSDSLTTTYACKICKKAFAAAKYYKAHVRSHFLPAGSRQFFCCGCYKTFETKGDILRHKANDKCSLKIKLYPCPFCAHSFNQESSLEAHKLKFHPEEEDDVAAEEAPATEETPGEVGEISLTCIACQKTYANRANFSRHMRLHEKSPHSSKCEFCGVYYASNKLLRAHLEVCTKKPEQAKVEPTNETKEKEEDFENPEEMIEQIEVTPQFDSVMDNARASLDPGVDCPHCGKHLMYKKNLAFHIRASCPGVIQEKHKCYRCLRVVPALKRSGLCINCGRADSVMKNKAKLRDMMRAKYKMEQESEQDDNVQTGLPVAPDIAKPIKSSGNVFQCPYGQRKFLHKYSLVKHMETCRGNCIPYKKISCVNCKNAFEAIAYREHKLYCTSSEPMLTVKQEFPTEAVSHETVPNLNASSRPFRSTPSVYSTRPLTPAESGGANSGGGLSGRLFLTDEGKRYQCQYCDKSYSKNAYAVQHEMRAHARERSGNLQNSSVASFSLPSTPLKRKRSSSPMGGSKKRKFCAPCKRFFRNTHAYSAHQRYHVNQRRRELQDATTPQENDQDHEGDMNAEGINQEENQGTEYEATDENSMSQYSVSSNIMKENYAGSGSDWLQICKICQKNTMTLKQLYKHTYYCIKKIIMRGESHSCPGCKETFDKNDTTKEFSLKSQNHCLNCYDIPYAPGEIPDEYNTKLLCFMCGYGFASVESQKSHMITEHYRKKESHQTSTQRGYATVNARSSEPRGSPLLMKEDGPVEELVVTPTVHLPEEEYISSREGEGSEGAVRKNHSCPHCNKQFLLVRHLRNHVKNKHKNEPELSDLSFTCKECGKSFNAAQKLRGHMQVHSISYAVRRQKQMEWHVTKLQRENINSDEVVDVGNNDSDYNDPSDLGNPTFDEGEGYEEEEGMGFSLEPEISIDEGVVHMDENEN